MTNLSSEAADQSGADRQTFTCDCGHTWLQGHSGSHYCSPNYQATIASLKAQIASTQPAPQPVEQANNALDVAVILHEAKQYFGFSQAKFKDDGTIVTAGVGKLIEFAHAIRAMPFATPQPFPAPAVQSGELPELPEPLEIFWPDLHHQALGCGIEDRNLHDRYECAEYGWQNGMERAMECVPDDLYDGDQMRDYARKAIAAQTAQARPDIIEKLTYHKYQRDDLTLDDCLEYLCNQWKKIHGRTERAMVMQITELLAAAPPTQAIAVEAWQPIETAPKDKKIIVGRVGLNSCAIAKWDDDLSIWRTDALFFADPTHWQPLPAAPSQGAKQ